MDTPTISSLTTVAGLAMVVTIGTQLILTVGQLSADASSRWGPLIAIALGMVFAVLAAVALGPVTSTLVANALLTGIFAGATAMGIHGVVVKSAVGTTVAAGLGVPPQPTAPQPPTFATIYGDPVPTPPPPTT